MVSVSSNHLVIGGKKGSYTGAGREVESVQYLPLLFWVALNFTFKAFLKNRIGFFHWGIYKYHLQLKGPPKDLYK